MSTSSEVKTKMLTAEEILAAQDCVVEEVEVPEWNGKVHIRAMDGRGRDEFEMAVTSQSSGNKVDIKGLKASLLSLCLVDEEGKLLFTRKQVEALNSKNGKVLGRLFEVAQKINGIGEEAVKELLKNSEGVLKDAGGSGSQDNSASQ